MSISHLFVSFEKFLSPVVSLVAGSDRRTIAVVLTSDSRAPVGLDVAVRRIAEFSGLRHPHHQRGAVVAWEIRE